MGSLALGRPPARSPRPAGRRSPDRRSTSGAPSAMLHRCTVPPSGEGGGDRRRRRCGTADGRRRQRRRAFARGSVSRPSGERPERSRHPRRRRPCRVRSAAGTRMTLPCSTAPPSTRRGKERSHRQAIDVAGVDPGQERFRKDVDRLAAEPAAEERADRFVRRPACRAAPLHQIKRHPEPPRPRQIARCGQARRDWSGMPNGASVRQRRGAGRARTTNARRGA